MYALPIGSRGEVGVMLEEERARRTLRSSGFQESCGLRPVT